jgi:crossover junction endodeoxyribonuclease RusA
MWHFELPYPPSVNHYWRRVGARTLISRAGRAFRTDVCSLLAARRVRPLSGPLKVDIDVYPPDRRRRDVDNLPKAILDALQHGGAYHDDSQIICLSITKHEVVPDGKTLVTIQQAEDDDTEC